MIFDVLFFNNLLWCILAFIINYALGHIAMALLKIQSQSVAFNDFLKCIFGALIIIGGYSIFKTNFYTINLGLLLAFFILLFILNNNTSRLTRKLSTTTLLTTIPFKHLLVYILGLIIFYSFQFFTVKNSFTNTYNLIHQDYFIYSTIVEHLNINGIEGNIYDWYFQTNYTRTIYHFGDLWYSAFFANLFNIKSIFSIILVFWTISFLFISIGMCAVFNALGEKTSPLVISFSVLLLFITGINFYIPKHTIFTRYDWWDFGLFHFSKIAFVVIIILLAINFLIRKNIFLFVFSMLLLPILTTVTAPPIYLSVSFFVFICWILKKIDLKQFGFITLLIVLNVLFLIAYMLAIKTSNNKSSVIAFQGDGIHSFFTLSYLKTMVNCIGGQVIKMALSIGLYIILWFLLKSKLSIIKENKLVFFFLALITFFGLMTYSFLNGMVDSIQIWSLFYMTTSSIFATLILYFTIRNGNRVYKIISIILVCGSLWQSFSNRNTATIDKEFYNTVLKNMHLEKSNNRIISFSGAADFNSIFTKATGWIVPLGYFKFIIDDYHPISLSCFSIPRDSTNISIYNTEQKLVETNSFYKYVQLQKQNHVFENVEKSQLDFIKSYKAKYAILYPNAKISSALNLLIEEKIISKDNYTFCKLKQ